jgi:hypothetical protein
MATTVREVMEHLLTGSVGDLDSPRYYNIRVMKLLMAQGLLPEGVKGTRAAAFAASA